jgi:ABC-type Fe3+/spermidine/putrescine transport system ATPase subunit
VAFGLEMRGYGAAERTDRVNRILDVVRMTGLGDRLPRQLSGGQQQRIALARALVIEPDLLLLDEPLSALDLKLREEMRDEIYRIIHELEITTVFVTHDQGEALVLSDIIAVMNGGRIEQLDEPQQLYNLPRTAFVARFIGGANVLDGRLAAGRFETGCGLSFPVSSDGKESKSVAIRPEDLTISADGAGVGARVERARFLGATIEYTLELESNGRITARTDARRFYPEGTSVRVSAESGRPVFLKE